MKILGQDVDVLLNQIKALIYNLLSWSKSYVPKLSKGPRDEDIRPNQHCCVVIKGPGGLDALELTPMSNEGEIFACVGYNIPQFPPPFVKSAQWHKLKEIPDDLVLVNIKYFSVNYADICIRWGLYESALRYVGWPIVAGFDFSGVVEVAGKSTAYSPGDEVFGFTMFGSYSTRLLVPSSQIRKVPKISKEVINQSFGLEQAAALSAVAATALHAVSLAGGWPRPPITKNRAALVHSAAGGVGSMLIQMLKVQGFHPIVAIVGTSHKKQTCLTLGADYVIIKKECKLWDEAERICPDGYAAIFDANGLETLQSSYDHLARCGKLVTYGFHSNLPKSSALLNPWHWIQMIAGMIQMPRFEPMSLVLDNKAILGFNLSFFADEHELIEAYMSQLIDWVQAGQVRVQDVAVFDVKEIGKAHELIQSGASVGKIVIRNPTILR